MVNPADAADGPGLSLLLVLKDPPDAGMHARLAALARVLPEAGILVYGHGDPDRLAPPLRELAALAPSVRFELATRRRPPGAALAQAVRGCAAPWVLWLPEQANPEESALAQRLWRAHRKGAFSGDPSQGPCLFERDALLALPCIPGMPSLLPELFSLHRGGRAGAAAPGLAARVRRAYVALACRMGLGRSSHRPLA